LLEQKQDWDPAETENSAENAVRIKSVHKSKGLEFPVVFLAELNSGFSSKDTSGDCLFDESETIGLRITNRLSKTKSRSIAHEVITEKKRKAMLAEEMRILYVAMTRAREKLILCASKEQKHCRKILTETSIVADEPIKNWQLSSVKSHFDWILYGLGNDRKLCDLLDVKFTDNLCDNNLFDAFLLDSNDLDKIAQNILQRKTSVAAPVKKRSDRVDKELITKVKSSLSWKYPFAGLTTLAAKTSVSGLTHPGDEFSAMDMTNTLNRQPKALTKTRDRRASGPDRKTIGTATHLILQEIDLFSDITPQTIQALIKKLIDQGKLDEEAGKLINFSSIKGFFDSDLGQLAIKHKSEVLREWPFTFALKADELISGESGKDEIVIDMIIATEQGLVVIDFKTDDIAADFANQRAKLYADQIRHYAKAASAILKSEILANWLYFLTPGCGISIEI